MARAGKQRAKATLDLLRRTHVYPVIDRWSLVLVALSMLRDCDASRVWEASFIAVNMHPLHRLGVDDWLQKVHGFVRAADKFEDEVVDLSSLLPQSWLVLPVEKRQEWLQIVKDHSESWDVEMLGDLRAADMPLCTMANIFKIYHLEKK